MTSYRIYMTELRQRSLTVDEQEPLGTASTGRWEQLLQYRSNTAQALIGDVLYLQSLYRSRFVFAVAPDGWHPPFRNDDHAVAVYPQ